MSAFCSRHFLTLLGETEPLDEFMEKVYDKYVPNIYVPEPGVMKEILTNVQLNAAIEYIPKLWSDMIIFDHTNRENLVTLVLEIMTSNEVNDKEMIENFAKIAWDVWNKIENQNPERIQKLK